MRRITMRPYWVLLLACILLSAWSVDASFAQPSKEKKPISRSIIITTASSGGAWYPIGGALGDLLETHAGIRGTPQVTAGSAENARLIGNKKSELGMISSETLLPAYRKEGVFKNEKLDNLRSIMAMFSLDLVVIALPNAPYKSFTDLKGRRVAVGPPGSGTMIGAKVLTEAYGMTFNDFKAMPLGFTDMYDGVADGNLDAMVLMATHPVSGAMNLATMKGMKFIPLDEKVLDKIVSEKPEFFKATIAANLYPGVKDAYKTIGGATILVTYKEMDEKAVYDMTKAILENVKRYEGAHPQMKLMRTESALNGITIPLHPGAERYYKEIRHPKLDQAPKP